MGTCTYCGKPAGLLRKYHKDCEEKFNEGWNKITKLAGLSAIKGTDYKTLFKEISEIANDSFIDEKKIELAIILGYEIAVEKFLDDGILSNEEEERLDAYQEYFNLTQDMLDKRGAYNKVVKAGILREVLEGSIPERMKVSGQLPFNFQKSEKLVWLFQDVPYHEQKVRRHFTGGYGGFSIKVAKGLYYRAGAFKGHPVEKTEMVYVDTGVLAITDKHLYFGSPRKNFRIKYDKIVTFTPYDDGIGIQRDASNAKPQIFITGDGWFTYNLVSNIAQL